MAKYGNFESRKPENPPIDLFVAPHQDKDLIVHAFGPNTYRKNLVEMQKTYSHDSDELGNHPRITFRPATTSESISAADFDFDKVAKPQIFDPNWLQARIVRTNKGFFTNTIEIDELVLNRLLSEKYNKSLVKSNGIWLIDETIAFAPYETFRQGDQDSKEFAGSGLARALEHTKGKTARNLANISDKKNYKLGVWVRGFDPTSEPIARVVNLGSDRDADSYRLVVVGDYWGGGGGGSAFGVSDSVAEGDASKKQ